MRYKGVRVWEMRSGGWGVLGLKHGYWASWADFGIVRSDVGALGCALSVPSVYT